MKCVIIVNQDLPLGLIANTSAVIAMSIGKQHGHVVGPDVHDQDGHVHSGITQIPIPLLKGTHELIKSIRDKIISERLSDLYMVDVCDQAQKAKKYEDYIASMQETETSQLSYLGIGLIGSPAVINRLTGSTPLLR